MQTGKGSLPKLRLSAGEARAVYEARLQYLWQYLDCSREYRLTDERPVKIRSVGELNTGAGPDFLNARIEIAGQTHVGAIEIHHRTSNWFRHHHHLDSRYHGVILHVVEEDDLDPAANPSLPPVLTFERLRSVSAPLRFFRNKCHLFFSVLEEDSLRGMLLGAAADRLRRKTSRLLGDALDFGINPAAVKGLADALGYRNNREAFGELFRRWSSYPEEVRFRYPAAILWGESGLLPDPVVTEMAPAMDAFVRQTWEDWSVLRTEAREPLNWVRHGNRPYNSPERRVAALIGLLEKTGCRPISWFRERMAGRTPAELGRLIASELTCSDPLWNSFTSFTTELGRPAAVLGHDRAMELAVNVILPGLLAAAEMERDPERGRREQTLCREAWLQVPAPAENRIVRKIRANWFQGRECGELLSTAAVVQGAMHLYREYCESCQGDCLSCLFYQSL